MYFLGQFVCFADGAIWPPKWTFKQNRDGLARIQLQEASELFWDQASSVFGSSDHL